jgi:hypothetical protein
LPSLRNWTNSNHKGLRRCLALSFCLHFGQETFFLEGDADDSYQRQEALKEVVKGIDTCYELSAQLARFVSVSHSGNPSSPAIAKEIPVDQSIPQIKVMELHAKLALKLSDQSLIAVIQVRVE